MSNVQEASIPAVVDAHHHLWRYVPEEFAWLDDRMSALRRDFGPEDLLAAMDASGVNRAIAVQARSSVEETAFLLRTAGRVPRIAGVVGWLPLAEREALGEALSLFSGEPKLVGVRHVVQEEGAGFLEGHEFNEGVARIAAEGLAYDLLLRADQLGEAARFVDRHPGANFILDHLAKPRVRAGEQEPWGRELAELALRPNVACKLSGLVTEADWEHWTPEQLMPFLDRALEAFGPGRLLAGSDWPVLLVASSYGRWWEFLREALSGLSADERAGILGGNAVRIYKLGTQVD